MVNFPDRSVPNKNRAMKLYEETKSRGAAEGKGEKLGIL